MSRARGMFFWTPTRVANCLPLQVNYIIGHSHKSLPTKLLNVKDDMTWKSKAPNVAYVSKWLWFQKKKPQNCTKRNHSFGTNGQPYKVAALKKKTPLNVYLPQVKIIHQVCGKTFNFKKIFLGSTFTQFASENKIYWFGFWAKNAWRGNSVESWIKFSSVISGFQKVKWLRKFEYCQVKDCQE